LRSSGDAEADLLASLIVRSGNNIGGVIELMETFPLQRIQNIMKFWTELTLSEEEREKRMRKEADKAAQEFHDQLFSGKIKKEDFVSDEGSKGSEDHQKDELRNSESLERYLDFMSGVSPDLLSTPLKKEQN
jgi:hypothetical protein